MAAAQAAADVICWQRASGATTRSTPRGLPDAAAGQICRPSATGTERAPPAEQANCCAAADEVEDGGKAVPAGQSAGDAHGPEHADVLSPARLPNVPAGHGAQKLALASAKVPGGHGLQAAKPGLLHQPAGQAAQAAPDCAAVPGEHTVQADDESVGGRALPAGQGAGDADGVTVDVGVGVPVLLLDKVGEGVPVFEAVTDASGVIEGVGDRLDEFDAEGVEEFDTEGVGVLLGVADKYAVGEGEFDGEGVGEFDTERVGVLVADKYAEGVGVIVADKYAVGEGVGVAMHVFTPCVSLLCQAQPAVPSQVQADELANEVASEGQLVQARLEPKPRFEKEFATQEHVCWPATLVESAGH